MEDKKNVTLMELRQLESTSEKLGREIRMLSRGVKKLLASSIKRETIVLLLSDYSKVSKPDIRAILLALENLENTYLNKEAQ